MRVATRARVQDAGTRLFARKGFAATSIRDIAREAGTSTGLIYRHYATKEDLFADLVGYAVAGLDAVIERFATVAPTGGGPSTAAGVLGDFTAEFVHDIERDEGFSEFFLLMNQLYSMDDPPVEVERLADRHRRLLRATSALIERGQAEGAFRAGDPAQLTTCYYAAIGGLVSMRLALRRDFVAPSAPLLMGFLTKERSRD
ncbi:TetR/AcrR family transcriptional regulator [Spiractinospora alimapuensis]|nr:TetR/AcrR family transcriptional regulator [Spiractinospora alimapuensis]